MKYTIELKEGEREAIIKLLRSIVVPAQDGYNLVQISNLFENAKNED